jgi:hypothetical protein
MMRRSRPITCGAAMPFGATVRLVLPVDPADPVVALPEDDLARIDGVLLRTAFADRAEEGDPGVVVTDGGLMALIAGESRWTELHRGKITNG